MVQTLLGHPSPFQPGVLDPAESLSGSVWIFTAWGGARKDKKGDHSTRGLEPTQTLGIAPGLGGTSQMPLSLGEVPMFTLINPFWFSADCRSHQRELRDALRLKDPGGW